jgi:hypothetical protein
LLRRRGERAGCQNPGLSCVNVIRIPAVPETMSYWFSRKNIYCPSAPSSAVLPRHQRCGWHQRPKGPRLLLCRSARSHRARLARRPACAQQSVLAVWQQQTVIIE